MARIVYSCCGEGRGHSSRTLTITRELLKLGHEVMLLASGQAYTYLHQNLSRVHSIPGLFLVYVNNQVNLWKTLRGNAAILRRKQAIADDLAAQLRPFKP